MDLTGRRVLVTGGSGFIGGRIVEKLICEYQAQVRVLVRNYANAVRLARFPVEFVYGSMQDERAVENAIRGCDIVFHCAHDSALKKNLQIEMAARSIYNLARAAIKEKVYRIIHVSSYAVYGHSQTEELREDSPWQNSKHPYVLAKQEAERVALYFFRKEGLPVVIVQPTIVYGPYCKAWTHRPLQLLKNYYMPLIDRGTGLCNGVYIDDCVEGIFAAATKAGIAGETFLISGDPPVQWRDFFGAFERMLHTRGTIEVTSGQIQKLLRESEKSQRTVHQIIKFIKHPKARSAMLHLPISRRSLHLLKNALPEKKWRKIEERLFSVNTSTNGKLQKNIFVPEPLQINLFRSHTRVNIDKARGILNYSPRFNLEKGMELTARYAEWANLN